MLVGREAVEFQLKEIKSIFSIKELGLATSMLGMGISQLANHRTLEQSAYVKAILREANFTNSDEKLTPWARPTVTLFI